MAEPKTSVIVGHVPPSSVNIKTKSPGHHKCPLPEPKICANHSSLLVLKSYRSKDISACHCNFEVLQSYQERKHPHTIEAYFTGTIAEQEIFEHL